MLWNKFQDCQVKFILRDHVLQQLGPSSVGYLESCLYLIIVISTGDFKIRWNVLLLVVQ